MDVAREAARYWHTLRHLRPVQFYGRARFRLWKPTPDSRPAPPLRKSNACWREPARRLSSLTGPRRFIFLNETGDLDEVGWDGPQRDKLWRYNQHYFDDLHAFAAADRHAWHLALIEDWIAHNPPGAGNGWEPYPLSLRVVNWIKWALGGVVLNPGVLHSLAMQVRWLSARLEFHLLGNHLFANAKALVFAGLFFEGKEADAWLSTGMRLLGRELTEQVLPDGGHFERSTLYHALALEDVLDLINIAHRFAPGLSAAQVAQVAQWPLWAGSMRRWLRAMSHPDGEIGLFNDAAFDIAPSPAELHAYAERVLSSSKAPPLVAVTHLQHSGYVRLAHGAAIALLDVAPVGPDYLPGHAHADSLCFELSVGTQRVLVNSGTSCYGNSVERLRQRGTPAHNTVVIDAEDSSEVWGGFRVARRAYPFALRVDTQDDGAVTEVHCAHDGYTRLPGKPVHRRTWRMDACSLTVQDQVDGRHRLAEARFHFHPDVQLCEVDGPRRGMARLSDGSDFTWHVERGDAKIERSTWHPRFGCRVPNACLVVTLTRGISHVSFSWTRSSA